jgi:hyperosmotically inducible periplasmic protein
MKRVHPLLLATFLAASSAGPMGCTGSGPRDSASHIDDQAINAKVKTELLADSGVSGLGVTVETYRGVVQLRGAVETAEQKRRATEIAQEIAGVKRVQNNLVVKPN